MSLWMTSFSVSIQMKATEQYSPVVLFIMLYTVVLVIMKKKNKQTNKTKQNKWSLSYIKIMPSCHHAIQSIMDCVHFSYSFVCLFL